MTYDGGKNGEGVWQTIINQMPPHRVYIEAFLGSGAVIRRKRPAEVNIGIEIDPVTIAAVRPLLTAVDVKEGSALPWLEILAGTDSMWPWGKSAAEDILVYADPPYLMDTRSCQRDLYRHEFSTPEEHEQLLGVLNSLPCRVMISGYHSELYHYSLPYPKWRSITFNAMTRRGLRVEWLWMNYPDPVALHDYRFLGQDNTERQRIRRKISRWKGKLSKLSSLERMAILHELKTLPASAASEA